MVYKERLLPALLSSRDNTCDNVIGRATIELIDTTELNCIRPRAQPSVTMARLDAGCIALLNLT